MDDYFGKSRLRGVRLRLYEIIFESDTPAGKAFDVGLMAVILASVAVVMAESVQPINLRYGEQLRAAEWLFTGLFTIEYLLRLYCVGYKRRYVFSFFGVVDLLAVLPGYAALMFPGARYLTVVRLLRVLRVFRVLKLAVYMSETTELSRALIASRRKIEVFTVCVLTLVVILGSMMYLIEGEENGFTSIPRSVYWAIVTLTTVGYGDISPRTNLGQFLAAAIMLLGYSILAVPTGIVTAEMSRPHPDKPAPGASGAAGPAPPAPPEPPPNYCKHCGGKL
ncbi:ion transporter [Alienimonas sp. DA493]|uniref:ion transporter n=1 Tax=Alienimonas sp. DA493 TaxID=3373605 RepID=UPI0037548C0D